MEKPRGGCINFPNQSEIGVSFRFRFFVCFSLLLNLNKIVLFSILKCPSLTATASQITFSVVKYI